MPAPRPCTQLGQWRPAGGRRETPADLPLLDSRGAFLTPGLREDPPSRPVPPPPLAQRARCQVGRGGESPMPGPPSLLPHSPAAAGRIFQLRLRTLRTLRTLGRSSGRPRQPRKDWADPWATRPGGRPAAGRAGRCAGAGALQAPLSSGSAVQAAWGPATTGGFCSEGRTPSSLYGWRPQTPIECLTKSGDRQDRHIRHILSL